jgi:hypothetical protein
VCERERESHRWHQNPFQHLFYSSGKKFHSISFIVKQIHLVTRLHTIGDILLQNILLQTTEENDKAKDILGT